MTEDERLFRDIIGLPVWGCKRIHGTIISIEIGNPSLIVRDAVNGSKISKLLHRRAYIIGDYSITINCDWILSIDGIYLDSNTASQDDIDRYLSKLVGEFIKELINNKDDKSIIIKFERDRCINILYDRLDDDQTIDFKSTKIIISLDRNGRFFI